MTNTDLKLSDLIIFNNIPNNDSSHTTIMNITNLSCASIPSLTRLEEFYAPIHAYLATAICLFGTTTNLLNAVVLTQKQMRNTTNAILTAIALVDSLTMISSGFHAIYLNFATSPYPENYPHSYVAIQILLLQNVITIGSHTISTGLLVQLAGFRCWILYSANVKPKTSYGMGTYHNHNSSQKRCVMLSMIFVCFLGIILSIPTFFIYTIQPLDIPNSSPPQQQQPTSDGLWTPNPFQNQTFFWFKVRDGAESLEHAHFVLYGCFVKILASILIFILTSFILIAMRTARKRYAKLQSLSNNRLGANKKPKFQTNLLSTLKNSIKHNDRNNKNNNDNDDNNTDSKNCNDTNNFGLKSGNTNDEKPFQPTKLSQKNRESQRVTIMLIVVVVSFVITEAPQGVLGTLVAIRGECFHNTVYVPLGDLLDLLVLLNSSINFILYCTMSQMFRQNFTHLVSKTCPCLFSQHTAGSLGQHRSSAVPVQFEVRGPATDK